MFLDVIKEYLQVNLLKVLVAVAIIGAVFGAGGFYIYTRYFEGSAKGEGFVEKGPSSPESKTNNATKIFIDISGAVNKPGVIAIETGKRVLDLINLAGGFDPLVSVPWVTRVLNLAQVLKDSQKIYIPFEYDIATNPSELNLIDIPEFYETIKQSTQSNPSKNTSGSLVNVNSASKSDLVDLPSIGDVTADKIILNRPYAGESEFKSKSGVTNSVFEKIKGLITY